MWFWSRNICYRHLLSQVQAFSKRVDDAELARFRVFVPKHSLLANSFSWLNSVSWQHAGPRAWRWALRSDRSTKMSKLIYWLRDDEEY